MHHKNYKVLPKGRIFFPLFFENTNAWLLGMGGSEITILKLLPAVPRLEDSLTPAPPGGFVTQCAAGLLWGKSMVTIFNHLWTPFTHIRRGVPILYGTFPRQPWTVMATSSSSGHTLTEASRGDCHCTKIRAHPAWHSLPRAQAECDSSEPVSQGTVLNAVTVTRGWHVCLSRNVK